MTSSKIENIPNELKELDQWINHEDKVPKTPSGGSTGHSEDNQWFSFEKVVENDKEIGFVFRESDPYVGIDLDDMRHDDKGDIDKEALDIIKDLDSWTEISRSGTGFHIIVKCDDFNTDDFHKQRDSDKGIEVYSHSRYFGLTGNIFGKEVREIREVDYSTLEDLMKKIDDKDQQSVIVPSEEMNRQKKKEEETDLSDEHVIERVKGSHPDLWNAPLGQPDDSAVDQGLMNVIAFYANRDRQQVESVFLQSPRGDRYTNPDAYGDKINKGHQAKLDHTVDEAISSVTSSFTGREKAPEKLEMDLDEALEMSTEVVEQKREETTEAKNGLDELELLFNEDHYISIFDEFLKPKGKRLVPPSFGFGASIFQLAVATDGFYKTAHFYDVPNVFMHIVGVSGGGKRFPQNYTEEILSHINTADSEDFSHASLGGSTTIQGLIKQQMETLTSYSEDDDEDDHFLSKERKQKRYFNDDEITSFWKGMMMNSGDEASARLSKIFDHSRGMSENAVRDTTNQDGVKGIENPYFNILGGVQPKIFENTLGEEIMEQGLYPRMLFVWPSEKVIDKYYEHSVDKTVPAPRADQTVADRLRRRLEVINFIGHCANESKFGDIAFVNSELSDDAMDLYVEWDKKTKKAIKEQSKDRSGVTIKNKADAHILKLSLLFQIGSKNFHDEAVDYIKELVIREEGEFDPNQSPDWEKYFDKDTEEELTDLIDEAEASDFNNLIISEEAMRYAIWYFDNLFFQTALGGLEGVMSENSIERYIHNKAMELATEHEGNYYVKRNDIWKSLTTRETRKNYEDIVNNLIKSNMLRVVDEDEEVYSVLNEGRGRNGDVLEVFESNRSIILETTEKPEDLTIPNGQFFS